MNATKINLVVEYQGVEGDDLGVIIELALKNSDNFTSKYKLINYSNEEFYTQELKHDSEYIYISCPHCQECEQQPIDQQRHHLGTMEIVQWLGDEGDIERSLMNCMCCNGGFIQLWDYKKEEELEEVEWDYHVGGKNGIFVDGDAELADWGTVVARTKEEAEEKAREELNAKFKELNKRLEGTGVELRLDESAEIWVTND